MIKRGPIFHHFEKISLQSEKNPIKSKIEKNFFKKTKFQGQKIHLYIGELRISPTHQSTHTRKARGSP